MGTISKTLENIFAAVAFAEEGEFDSARQVTAEDQAVGKAAAHKKTAPDRDGLIHAFPITES